MVLTMHKRILVITDCSDVAANELSAVLALSLEKLGADDIIIEPVVTVPEFSVLNASFVARLLVESYDPEYLTILSVVNPLDTSNSKRARIAGKLKNGLQFVGGNTGVFSLLINDFGIDELYETDQTGLKGDKFISFGGKYIHAPIAAKLAATGDLDVVKVGDFTEKDLIKLPYDKGVVLHIDNFGVAKIFYTLKQLNPKPNQKFRLTVNSEDKGDIVFCGSMKELDDEALAIYQGSSLGLLEIGYVRRTGTAQKLRINIGDTIELHPRGS